jgi:hypothetical protein
MASTTSIGIDERIVQCLSSNLRLRFLAALAHELTIAARGAYPEASTDPDRSTEALRYSNEMVMVVVKQLRASLGADDVGYPDRAFINVLLETARAGGREQALHFSVDRAMNLA